MADPCLGVGLFREPSGRRSLVCSLRSRVRKWKIRYEVGIREDEH